MGINLGPAPRMIPGGMPRRCLIEMDDGRWIEGYVKRMEWSQRPRVLSYLTDGDERYAMPGMAQPIEISLELYVPDTGQPDPSVVETALAAVKIDRRIPTPTPPPGWKVPEEAQAATPEDPEQYRSKPEPAPPAVDLQRFGELETDEEK